MPSSGYLSQIEVDHHEIHDGEVFIVFTNGDCLSGKDAREFAMRINEELRMGEFLLDFARHQSRPDSRYH